MYLGFPAVEYKIAALEDSCQCDNPDCWLKNYGSRYSLLLYRVGGVYDITWWLSKN